MTHGTFWRRECLTGGSDPKKRELAESIESEKDLALYEESMHVERLSQQERSGYREQERK